MDVVSAASALRSQLVALHNSDVTVSQLERSITSLDQQSLMSAIEDNQSQHLRIVLRLSVNEGVCHMYKQFSNRKWAELEVRFQCYMVADCVIYDNAEIPCRKLLDVSPSIQTQVGTWVEPFLKPAGWFPHIRTVHPKKGFQFTAVQNTARSIKSSMEEDDNEQTNSVMTSSPTGGSTGQDKAAEVWTSLFCELSRAD